MADNKLIFPIGFDLEKGVKEALEDGDKAIERLYNALAKKPITVKLKLDSEEALSRSTKTLSGLKKEIAEINREWNSLSASDRGGALGAQIMARYRALTQEAKGYTSTVGAAVKLEDKLAREREKSANAAAKAAQRTREYNKELSNQSSYVNNLLRKMAVLWGVHSVQSFLTGVREVTAEFELQRVSLGAIIQDQQRANQLFSEIKSFALQSPLKILDLTKYTKQVAAYGIETEKLFDTTKRLADVSVGLGVDMGRLVLAYGQVKAASYLRAAEIRQFTEAGIPMLELLAEKFTDLQGKMVSTEQVMDLVSKRAVSFSMVEDIFNDMTSAGGMFYNMQEKQAQTLFGMWSKLGDAAAMMYDEIGNTDWVNSGMKMTIGLLESMMRNWKTTARVLDTVAAALTVYVVGLKNAAIASKALTSAVALENLAHQQQIIRIPRIVAGIIGINNVKKVSTILTRIHTKAVLAEAAATNVLTKGFWKLTAAMLANPWVAVTAAIAAAGMALFHFMGNTETTSERVEKLNNSVASLKNLNGTVAPLIKTYNDLADKTELTADKQKKLSAVTHELAKRYPGAVTAIGNFGEEVELVSDKLNDLYQAEKNARMDNTRNELEKTEQKITETEEKIAKLQKSLQEGTKTEVSVNRRTGYVQTSTVQMSDEDRGKILRQIDELRQELIGLINVAEAAEAAMKGITIKQLRIEKSGGWKEELQGFSKVVDGLNMGKPIRLFDDTTINGFKSLDDALQQTAKQYKDNKALAEQYADTLKSTTISPETRAQTEELKAEAETMAELSYAALVRFNALKLLQSSGGSGGSDPRLGVLQEMVSTLKNINKEYDELAKKEGTTKALADTQRVYADTFKNMQQLAKKYKFTLPDFDVPTDAASLTKYLNAIREAMKKLPKSDKAVLALQVDIDKLDIDNQQKKIEKQIKVLADRILRTKTAKEFYDKVLGMTGDYELAATFSMSVYGNTGEQLKADIINQIERAFKSGDKTEIDLSSAINYNTKQVDYAKLRRIYDQYQDHIIDKNKETARKLVEDGEKASADQILLWLKDLEKAKTFAEKRVELAQYTANQIAAIEASALPQEQKSEMTKRYKIREDKETAKLEYETFKNSPMYVAMFEKLDAASTTMLKNMKKRLMALKGEWKNLDPTQIKELQSRLNEVNNQLAAKNPYRTLIQSFKEWKTLREQGTRKDAEQELINKTQELERAEALLVYRIQQAEAAQKAYNDAVAEHGLHSQEAQQAKLELSFAEQQKKKQAEIVETTRESANEAENLVNSWKSLGEQVGGAWAQMDAINQAIVGLANDLKDAFGGFGSDADAQYFDDMVASFSNLSSGIANIGQGILTGNPVSIIKGIGSAISGVVGLFTAGKVRRANKEIERQQKLLDQLEYTYGRLEQATDKLFGRDYIQNYNQRVETLEAQQQAYLKQAEAERSKGKKADKDKIKEYEEQARDTADKIKEMQSELSEFFLGTDLSSAARDFANAWLDAYISFSSTTDALKEKFDDMVKNMVINSVMAKVVERVLKPLFDEVDKLAKDGDLSVEDISTVMSKVPGYIEKIDNGMKVATASLKAAGVDMESLRDTSSEFSGIARDIASASEESINGLAAGINTQNYYISYVPQIAEHVAAMRQLMEQGTTTALPEAAAAGWTDWQKQAMDNYNAIARNTAETVAECRRSAAACEAFAADIHRMIEFSGGKHRLNVKL